jgi:hypothetical protein
MPQDWRPQPEAEQQGQLAYHERYAYDKQYRRWQIVQYNYDTGSRRYLNVRSLVTAADW